MSESGFLQHRGSLIDRIVADRPSLSRAFRCVADAVIEAPGDFMVRSIQDFAAVAGVSEPSVIRFCRHFGFDGVPEFRIALAMSLAADTTAARRPFLEPNITDKAFVQRGTKLAIAKKAASLIDSDQSLILDSGSTVQMFAQHLRTVAGRTILTTSLGIVETLWGCEQHRIILPGGTVRFEARALTGRMVEQSLANMRIDTVYFGADSVDPEQGLSTFIEKEAHQNAAMAQTCQRIVVLVDSTKFRAPSLHRFCRIEDIDIIVTDHRVADEVVASLTGHGVTVMIAEALMEIAA